MVDASAPVKVLIVDDQAPFRRAAKTAVQLTPGFAVVGEAESGEEGVTLTETLAPDLVLMDINLPGISGIEAVRRITAVRPEVLSILLSTYREEDLPADARSSGAAGYVHKEDFGPVLLRELWENRGSPAWHG